MAKRVNFRPGSPFPAVPATLYLLLPTGSQGAGRARRYVAPSWRSGVLPVPLGRANAL